MAKNSIDIVITAKDLANNALSGVNKSIGEIGNSTDGLRAKLNTNAKSFLKFGAIGATAVAGIGVVATKLVKDASRGLQLQQFFLSEFGDNVEENLDRLSEAAKGTIPDVELMETANRAALLGVSDNIGELAELMEVARVRGNAMGLDTTTAFNDIVTGIGRGSPLILDNLGIQIPEAFKEMTEGMTEAEKKQALLNFVLEDGAQLAGELGSSTTTSADAFAQFNTMTANARQEIGESLTPAFTELSTAVLPLVQSGLGGVVGLMRDNEEVMLAFAESVTGSFNEFKKGYEDTAPQREEFQAALNDQLEGFREMIGLQQSVNAETINWSKNLGVLAGWLKQVLDLLAFGFIAAIDLVVQGVRGWKIIFTEFVSLWLNGIRNAQANIELFITVAKGKWIEFKASAREAIDSVKVFIDGLIQKVNSIPGVGAIASAVEGASGALSFLPGLATGTNFAQGGPTIVGERGPEIVNLPRGSQVVNNERLRASGGMNGEATININIGSVNDSEQVRRVADAVAQVLSRQNNLSNLGVI